MTSQAQSEVRTAATTRELDACARTLASAFADDPLMSVIWPDTDRRHAALPRYFTASLRYEHSRIGVVDHLTDPTGRPIAVAAWDGPDRGGTLAGLGRTLRGAPRTVSALGGRLVAGLDVRRRLDAHAPTGRHWTLVNLGVTPAAQKSGLARILLDHRLASVDADEHPAHLVCTRAENVALYRRFEFDVSEEFALVDGTPLWSMDRPPAHR
ncbi:N-acetyltransferase [Williamsia sp. MIQD14]|uniref:N-acetyltransferase n=1 Tax=Williamsia sp. MIQD14 TaxID=3425703 RepID=UPI003D9FB6B2